MYSGHFIPVLAPNYLGCVY